MVLPFGIVSGRVTTLSLPDSSKPSDWWLVPLPGMSKRGKRNWDHDAGLKTLPLGNSRKTSWCHIALGRDVEISPHTWTPFLVDRFDGFEGRCSGRSEISPGVPNGQSGLASNQCPRSLRSDPDTMIRTTVYTGHWQQNTNTVCLWRGSCCIGIKPTDVYRVPMMC